MTVCVMQKCKFLENRAKGENAFRKNIIKILCIIEPNLDGLFHSIIENVYTNYMKYKPVTTNITKLWRCQIF